MSASPTKGGSTLPSPNMPGRRRGHAHRRSGAISTHELPILRSADSASCKTGSAPATPCEPDGHRQFIPSLDSSTSQPTLAQANTATEASPKPPDSSSPPTVQNRPRVGFSDRLEYIPRPLSIISSATSSSVSTVRPVHSLSESISSLRSNNTPSPSSAGKSDGDDVFEGELRANPDEFLDEPGTFRIAIRTPRHYSPPPPDTSESDEETLVPQAGNNSTPGAVPLPDSALSPDYFREAEEDEFVTNYYESQGVGDEASNIPPTNSSGAKSSKRRVKGKSWAGLLSRRSKPSGSADSGDEMSPLQIQGVKQTYSLQEPATSGEFSLSEVNFDEDSTFVVRSPQFDVPRSAPANPTPAWNSGSDDEMDVNGVLDLDAAWDSAGKEIRARGGSKTFRPAKRRLHSSGTTGAFIGPGMHYHRRAESAPVMTPVDYQFGFPRFGSNPQMADVFEEDEDEDNHKTPAPNRWTPPKRSNDHQKPSGLGVEVAGNTSFVAPASPRSPEKRNSRSDLSVVVQKEEQACSSRVDPMEHSEVTGEMAAEIVNAKDELRFSVVTKSSDGSTITPTLSNDPLRIRPIPASLDFASASPEHLTGFGSLNPSPSPAKSSFDIPRLGTAHSSTTNQSGWSSTRGGEGVVGMGYSAEDVPSLTSSASTMVSHRVPITPLVGTRPEAERSHSLSEAVPDRTDASSTSKRRSLASLPLLRLGSSSGKSKLSTETRPGQDGAERGERTKEKKRHKIRKMMKFWNKSKEDLKA